MEVSKEAPRARQVEFEHAPHADLTCTQCHVTPVSLEPESGVTACTACHDDHHAVDMECAACHRTDSIIEAHAPPIDAHRACDDCHTAATVAALEPTRSFCLACHPSTTDHYEQKECSVCHLQAPPGEYRTRLTGGGS